MIYLCKRETLRGSQRWGRVFPWKFQQKNLQQRYIDRSSSTRWFTRLWISFQIFNHLFPRLCAPYVSSFRFLVVSLLRYLQSICRLLGTFNTFCVVCLQSYKMARFSHCDTYSRYRLTLISFYHNHLILGFRLLCPGFWRLPDDLPI